MPHNSEVWTGMTKSQMDKGKTSDWIAPKLQHVFWRTIIFPALLLKEYLFRPHCHQWWTVSVAGHRAGLVVCHDPWSLFERDTTRVTVQSFYGILVAWGWILVLYFNMFFYCQSSCTDNRWILWQTSSVFPSKIIHLLMVLRHQLWILPKCCFYLNP